MRSGRALASPARALAAVLLVSAVGAGASACGGDGTPVRGATGPTATASATPGPRDGELLDVAAFVTAIERPGTTILDVRTPAEFATGHLAGAVNLDVQGAGFADAVAGLDPARTYAVYCHSGSRSAVAVAQLVDRGFTSVYQLAGGITAWTAAGRPVTTS